MSCPLTEDWIEPNPAPARAVEVRLARNARRRQRYAVERQERWQREREAMIARRVLHPTEPFELR